MKKSINLILCFVALATFCAASCEKDNEGDNNSNNGNNGNGYSAQMFVGTWRVDNMTVNGENNTPENMLFIMNEDGTGLANDNGVTENNGFTWSVSGDQLTITPRSGVHYVYTVNNLSESECTFSGTNVPMADIPGNVVVHLLRVR
ncbi:MAG: lipocalin family protein [Bacteroidales bacterium]|nr:lipocalin family protein [Bacteroidales bacterium]